MILFWKEFKSYVCSVLLPDHYIQTNQVNTELLLDKELLSTKTIEPDLIHYF